MSKPSEPVPDEYKWVDENWAYWEQYHRMSGKLMILQLIMIVSGVAFTYWYLDIPWTQDEEFLRFQRQVMEHANNNENGVSLKNGGKVISTTPSSPEDYGCSVSEPNQKSTQEKSKVSYFESISGLLTKLKNVNNDIRDSNRRLKICLRFGDSAVINKYCTDLADFGTDNIMFFHPAQGVAKETTGTVLRAMAKRCEELFCENMTSPGKLFSCHEHEILRGKRNGVGSQDSQIDLLLPSRNFIDFLILFPASVDIEFDEMFYNEKETLVLQDMLENIQSCVNFKSCGKCKDANFATLAIREQPLKPVRYQDYQEEFLSATNVASM